MAHSSKFKAISQTIRKPKRQECGVGILDFLGMNLKSIHINHGHPATMKVSDYISPKYQSTSVISCGYFGAVELLFSVI